MKHRRVKKTRKHFLKRNKRNTRKQNKTRRYKKNICRMRGG